MKLVIIDPGHGGSDPGAVYKEKDEKKYNLELAKKIEAYLKNNYEVTVKLTRNTDATVSLDARTDFANKEKADFYLSIHQNSGGGEGFESYVYNGAGSETKAIQNAIHAETAKIMQKYNVKNRGQKQANFHVLRETKMPAVLLEVVFIDNEQNAALLMKSEFQNEAAKAIAIGTAKALSLKEVSKDLFLVNAGAFEEKKNAAERISFLAEKKIAAFIDETVIDNKTYYRVQAGAYEIRQNADDQVQKIKSLGIKDAYVMIKGEENPKPEPEPKPEPPKGLTIKGQSVLTAAEMENVVRKVNPKAPSLADYYVEIGQVYGIRADVAYAQAIHETGYFRFESGVKASQNNFSGIGATGKGESATFKTPKEGVLAHMQHLFAYASKDQLPAQYPLVDPRFQLVQRGSALTWNQLNGKWAVPGTNYSKMILEIYRKMLVESKMPLEQKIETINSQLKEI
ncbi:N-acetylmuramoyl-L-alanine amidase [Fictibacillus barbaricus]|uniref:N-acetylmuramoyl-L-alanine amidase n=1 Tax=Fictibacillus barbaricus TaxID=182136 RepID=A0ABU1TZM4_9BACL|nr:N-acetylmuramoyl-L-alanine amidase [Fictibacillus barbaricus]MDR7072636.1 N-acetylmuramoyl-L-alanine amidase [Fictibacillus barbaricus]